MGLKKSGGKKKWVSNRQKWGQTKIFPTENVAQKRRPTNWQKFGKSNRQKFW